MVRDVERTGLKRCLLALEPDQALLQAANVASLPRPDESNLQLLRDWLADSGRDGQTSFLQGYEFFTWEEENGEDLVALVSRQNEDPLGKFFGHHLVNWYHRLIGARSSHHTVDKDKGIVQYSDSAVAKWVIFLASIIASVLPVMAIVVLFYIHNLESRIWVTVCMTWVFAATLAITTSVRPQELFTATAAFAAVEVVFIGSVNSSSS